MTTAVPTPGHLAAPTPPDGDNPTQAPPAAAQRLAWLFRASTQAGHVHPLRALLEHYRAGASS